MHENDLKIRSNLVKKVIIRVPKCLSSRSSKGKNKTSSNLENMSTVILTTKKINVRKKEEKTTANICPC